MPQSFACCYCHLIFSTKDRAPIITAKVQPRLFDYIGGILRSEGCVLISAGGMPDHVHLLFVLARTLSLSKVVEEVKKETSKWAKEHVHPGFYWQNGYGAFSVSPSNVPAVRPLTSNERSLPSRSQASTRTPAKRRTSPRRFGTLRHPS